ncbi:cell division protein FtsL [Streptococcus sp. DD13]|uniref:cell division protein FtsL n=1 Tax=Streptococcus sp. DD13 TaxID=1777881 RepID=UPI00079C5225|nr:cell division protein FtsL [Streptococcus sp. DD13]KXT78221.1 Cell division protein FtsL [Streptococcus sp. DD13]
MLPSQDKETSRNLLTKRFQTFSRIEKAFYSSIVFSGVVLAIGIIFLQTRLQQVRLEMADITQQNEAKQVEINEAEQSINELGSYANLMKIAKKGKLTFNNQNIGVVNPDE